MADDSLAARFAAADLDWIVPDWPRSSRVRGFVTTRRHGTPPHGAMNIGDAHPALARTDDVAAIDDSRQRLAQFVPAAPVWLHQVHGTAVATIDAAGADAARATPPVADAAVTRSPGVVLAVRTADCLPVFIANREETVIGVAHAGWRGLAAGVLDATIAAMDAEPASLAAWLGPAIGPQAFEVGSDVRDAFCRDDPGAAGAFVAHRPGKWHANLYALARRNLKRIGVTNIAGAGFCTHTDADRFFSYRRERDTGRMAAVIWIEQQGLGARD
jgi:YfiH family protein